MIAPPTICKHTAITHDHTLIRSGSTGVSFEEATMCSIVNQLQKVGAGGRSLGHGLVGFDFRPPIIAIVTVIAILTNWQ